MQLYLQRFRIVLLFLYAVRVGASEGGQGGTYKVEVVRTDGDDFSVYVEPTQTVVSFKQVIREVLGDAGKGVSTTLMFGFKTLQNYRDKKSKAAYTLEDYKIQHGSQVKLFTREKRNKSHINERSEPKGPVIKEAYKALLLRIVKELELEPWRGMYKMYQLLGLNLDNSITDVFIQQGEYINIVRIQSNDNPRIQDLKLIYKDDEKVVDYFCKLIMDTYIGGQDVAFTFHVWLLAVTNHQQGIHIDNMGYLFANNCMVVNKHNFNKSFAKYEVLRQAIQRRTDMTCLVEGYAKENFVAIPCVLVMCIIHFLCKDSYKMLD